MQVWCSLEAHQSTDHLADCGVAGEHIGDFNESEMGGRGRGDLEDTAPFSESAPSPAIFLTTLRQVVQPLCGALVKGAWEHDKILVHLDARNDASILCAMHNRK